MARLATASPMRPRPRTPRTLPPTDVVSGYGPREAQLPARRYCSDWGNLRSVFSTSASAVSATHSLSTSGVLVTMILRFFASSRLIASTPTPKFEMISSLGSASISLPSTGIGPKVARPRTAGAFCLRKLARSGASASKCVLNSDCSVAIVPAWPLAVMMISGFMVS